MLLNSPSPIPARTSAMSETKKSLKSTVTPAFQHVIVLHYFCDSKSGYLGMCSCISVLHVPREIADLISIFG